MRVGIAPYLKTLRELVGHELLVLPSVGVLVWDELGDLLMVRDIAMADWHTIGGAIEPDESRQQAAIREASKAAGSAV